MSPTFPMSRHESFWMRIVTRANARAAARSQMLALLASSHAPLAAASQSALHLRSRGDHDPLPAPSGPHNRTRA